MNSGRRGLGGLARASARSRPDALAVRDAGGSWTFAELAAAAERFAAEIVGAGGRSGDRVVFSATVGRAYIGALLGTWLADAAFVPVNPALPPGVAAHIVESAAPRVIIRAEDSNVTVALGTARPTILALAEDMSPLLIAFGDRSGQFSVPDATTDAPALIAWTSGTTGEPKGVVLTAANLLANALNLALVGAIGSTDRLLIAATLYRMGGVALALQGLLTGAAVLVAPPSAAVGLPAIATEWDATIVFGGPDQLRPIADAVALPHLRYVFAGGSPVSSEFVARFAALGVGVAAAYGLSEAAPMLLYASPDESAARGGSAGTPPPLVEVRIVNRDGNDVPPGQTGELIARGPNVMAGYWRRPDLTRERVRDGWLWTGDSATVGPDGAIRILGRSEEAIATAAGTVFAAEVEALAHRNDAVAEAVAVGVPSGGQERVGLAIVARDEMAVTLLDVEAVLRTDPRITDPIVMVVPNIPRSAAGKPLRREVAKLLAQST